jgi:hypothetical protein
MSTRRLILRRLSIVLVGTMFPFGSLGCKGRQPPSGQSPPTSTAGVPTPVQGGTQSAQAGDVVCETYCSPTSRTPVAEIRWVVSTQPAAAESLRTLASQQNIEAAVNEDGFERGRFVRLSSVAPQARFAPASPAAAGTALPGLGSLTVNAVSSSQDAPGALRLATPAEAGRENVVLQVQGLQAGMNYYWRVRPPTQGEPQVVMCRAPICPSDRKRP